MKKDLEVFNIVCGKVYEADMTNPLVCEVLESIDSTEAEIVIDYTNSRIDIDDYDNGFMFSAKIKKDGTMGALKKKKEA